MSTSNPFDFVKAILQTKENLFVDQESENTYNSFIINRALSYHRDCIFFANMMNGNPFLDKKLQHDFYINIIRSQKRPFAKWIKKEQSDDLECVKKVYNISDTKAREVLPLLSKEQIEYLQNITDIGGIKEK